MSACRLSVRGEPSFAELGMRVRLNLARALTEAVKVWIDDPGVTDETRYAFRGPGWWVLSARGATGAIRLRAMLPDALEPQAFIAEAFRAVLGRSPDAMGLASYTDVLLRDPAGRRRLLETLAKSEEAGRSGETFRFSRREGSVAQC